MTVHAMEIASRSHVGLLRKKNQDYLSALSNLGIIVLGDGMGGHCAGEVASRIAVDAASENLLPAQQDDTADDLESLLRIGEAAEVANQAIFAEVEKHPENQGMGTTFVAAIFREGRVFYSHVGDSRLYRIRAGRIRSLTRDHSLIQELVDTGVFASRAAAHHAGVKDNVLTRSLGLDPDVEVDVGDCLLDAGDIYLACSDGLCGKVPDKEIAHILRDKHGDLELMAENLLNAALDAGGRDNISLILARKKT